MTALPEKELPQKKNHISREEEYALIRAYQKTSEEKVYEKLLNAHNRYILSCAQKKSEQTGVDIDDLYQEACLGFLRAIEKFNLNLKPQVRLLSYATYWMDVRMDRYASRNRTTQTTAADLSPKDQKIVKLYKDLLKERGKENCPESLDPEEKAAIEKELGHTLGEIAEIQARFFMPTKSLNDALPDNEKGNTTFLDILPETKPGALEQLSLESDLRHLRAVFNQTNLKPKERQVIELVYFHGGEKRGNLAEIARVMGVTREYVRQLDESAIKKMKITSDHMHLLAEEKLTETWPAPLPALTRK